MHLIALAFEILMGPSAALAGFTCPSPSAFQRSFENTFEAVNYAPEAEFFGPLFQFGQKLDEPLRMSSKDQTEIHNAVAILRCDSPGGSTESQATLIGNGCQVITCSHCVRDYRQSPSRLNANCYLKKQGRSTIVDGTQLDMREESVKTFNITGDKSKEVTVVKLKECATDKNRKPIAGLPVCKREPFAFNEKFAIVTAIMYDETNSQRLKWEPEQPTVQQCSRKSTFMFNDVNFPVSFVACTSMPGSSGGIVLTRRSANEPLCIGAILMDGGGTDRNHKPFDPVKGGWAKTVSIRPDNYDDIIVFEKSGVTRTVQIKN